MEQVVAATCGKRVTATIVGYNSKREDLIMAYRRALAADPYNAEILNQYPMYKNMYDLYQDVEKAVKNSSSSSVGGCFLCIGETLCPLCQLKNDFMDVLDHNIQDKKVGKGTISIEDLTNMLLHDNKN